MSLFHKGTACCAQTKWRSITPPYSLVRIITRSYFGLPKHDTTVHFTSDDEYCADRVRKMDHEHYIHGLFFPTKARKSYYAVRALNIELATIKDTTTSASSAAPARFDFWRQVIDKIYETSTRPPPHPIARALAEAVSTHKLSKHFFKTIIHKRDNDVRDIQPRTMDDLQSYVEGTASCLMYLSLECLGLKDMKTDHAAFHLGVAEGLVTLLRGTAFHAKNRKIYFPVQLTTKYEVIPENLFRGEIPPHFADLVWDVASTAKVHLEKARAFRSSVPPEAVPAFLYSVVVEDFLTRLQKSDFNVFDPSLQSKNYWNYWKMLYSNYKQKY